VVANAIVAKVQPRSDRHLKFFIVMKEKEFNDPLKMINPNKMC
jgi:hypothetical protein